MSKAELIQKLPKAELHLHIEGTFEPELMFQIAQRNQVSIPYHSVHEIRNAYNFHSLQSFLDIYYQGANVLLRRRDFYDLTMDYLRKCSEDHVVHTEIFFDPQTHTQRNVPFIEIIEGISEALEAGKRKWGITSKVIMCFLRHLTEEDAFQTLEASLPFKDKIAAVGLDSSELGHPPSKFQRVYEKARSYGYRSVAHAGEEGPVEYMWEALDLLKAERIDHGVRVTDDPKLLQRVIDEKIPLTMCPFSNIKLCVFSDLKDHNLKQLLHQGVKVTINSDDPAYFGGYVNQNYLETAQVLDLSNDDITKIAIHSFEASFLSPTDKQRWIDEIQTL